MKIPIKKLIDEKKSNDDSLFGLLSSYKTLISYFRVLQSEEEHKAVIQLTDNPKKWSLIPKNKYSGYKILRRLELGVTKLSVKYISPEYIIKYMGPMFGMKLHSKKVTILNNLNMDGYFILETSIASLPIIIQTIKRIITLSPQKKYEIIEKCLEKNSQG